MADVKNSSATPNVVAAKAVTPEIDERNRYIVNGADFGLTIPVRFNERLTQAQIAGFLSSSAFQQAVRRATAMQMAIAVDGHGNFRPVNMPTNILALGSSSTGVGTQDFGLAALADQAKKILELNGAVLGSFKAPMRGAIFAGVTFEGDVAHIVVTLKNGRKAHIAISMEK